jgi:hypothetical protein
MTGPRAADDFATIRARLKELRQGGIEAHDRDAPTDGMQPLRDPDSRFKDRREGVPPPWVPTIFSGDPVAR